MREVEQRAKAVAVTPLSVSWIRGYDTAVVGAARVPHLSRR